MQECGNMEVHIDRLQTDIEIRVVTESSGLRNLDRQYLNSRFLQGLRKGTGQAIFSNRIHHTRKIGENTHAVDLFQNGSIINVRRVTNGAIKTDLRHALMKSR